MSFDLFRKYSYSRCDGYAGDAEMRAFRRTFSCIVAFRRINWT